MALLTHSGLLASALVKIGRVVRRIKAAGAASRTTFRDRGRAAARRVRRIASTLRLRGAEDRQEAQATVAGEKETESNLRSSATEPPTFNWHGLISA